MIVERNIERDWVYEAIRKPDFIEVDPSRPGIKRAFDASLNAAIVFCASRTQNPRITLAL